MKISSVSSYSDGHESTIEYLINDADVPAWIRRDDLWGAPDGDELWEFLCQYMGDGHGEDSSLGWYYLITILEAADPELVGLSHENAGN